MLLLIQYTTNRQKLISSQKSNPINSFRIKTSMCVKQRGKMSRGSGKTASKTVHPAMCHDPVFCRSNLGCYLWNLLPKLEGVIL